MVTNHLMLYLSVILNNLKPVVISSFLGNKWWLILPVLHCSAILLLIIPNNSSRFIWTPDPIFTGQHSQEDIKSLAFKTSPERFVSRRPNEISNIKLQYSANIKVDVICDMQFQDFPFDTQRCPFYISSLKEQTNIR